MRMGSIGWKYMSGLPRPAHPSPSYPALPALARPIPPCSSRPNPPYCLDLRMPLPQTLTVRTFADRAEGLAHFMGRAGEAPRLIAWDDGVRVTAVCPSFVATDLTAGVTKVSRSEMIDPGDLAEVVAMALALPNTAAIAELLVNCRLEDTL